MSRKPVRRPASVAARLRPFWFLIAVVVCAAAFAGYYCATWPGFYPKSVTVNGNRVVASQTIVARAAIERHENVWLQNMQAAARRVQSIPYVGDVEIHRSLPAGVHIVVTERTPYATVRDRGASVVVDRDLRVLERGGSATQPELITAATLPSAGAFITDAGTQALLRDYEALARAHVAAARLEHDKFGDLVAVTRGGVRLLLGDESELQRTAQLVDPILSQVAANGRKIAAVDLRAPKTPVVMYK